jgi:putative adenylate-forming enzyme
MNLRTPIVFAAHYIRARRRRSLSGSRLRDYQDLRAKAIIAWAVAKSPFYREHFAGLSLENWREFPVVNKEMMMANFSSFTTVGLDRDEAMNLALSAEGSGQYRDRIRNLTVGLSSGTSGHRGLFVVNDWERSVWSANLLAWVLPGHRFSGYKAILFLRSGSNLYDSIDCGWLRFRYCDLMTPLQEAVAILNKFSPDVLVGPPSFLVMLASEAQTARLVIKPMKVISVAEVLTPEDEQIIGNAFGFPVHQIYQCTEGFLAATCHRGALHVAEDCVALQFEVITQEDPTRVTPLVTDLWRETQPVIRYRLNDVLVLDPSPCGCGSAYQRITRIEGRHDDVFYFSKADGALRPFFPDVIRRMVLLGSSGVLDYEVVQDGVGRLRAHVEPNGLEPFPLIERRVRASAERILTLYGCTATAIEVVPGLPVRRPNEKRRRIRRDHTLSRPDAS